MSENDIVPELLEKIMNDFEENVSLIRAEETFEALLKSNNLEDAYEIAREIGGALSESFSKFITEDILPNGRMYYNIANRIIPPSLKKAYNEAEKLTEVIMSNVLSKSKIGIKVQQGLLNQDRITGIVDRLSDAENYQDVKFLTGKAVVQNVTQSAVDDTIEANAQFLYKSGLRSTVVRKLGGNCCAWCRSLIGSYTYPNVPADVYRRHENCRCTVTFYPSKASRGQDVWSKKEVDIENQNKTNQSIHVNKKKIQAFASGKHCYDATDEWYANKKNYSVIKNNDKYIDLNGVRYEVDGSKILFNPSDSEKQVARLLADNFGGKIELNPRINIPKDTKLADYFYNGESLDLKTIEGKSKHVLYNAIKNKKDQAQKFVVDISYESITKEEAIKQIENDIFYSKHTRFVDTIILIKNNKILNVFERI